MEVDLVICFDANVSPLRMIQRMGRTGRKNEGRVDILLSCLICFIARFSAFEISNDKAYLYKSSLTNILVLACEGTELKGYIRKQAKGKAIKKHMLNGGANSFCFHPSPRMVGFIFR